MSDGTSGGEASPIFRESHLGGTPIRDLGLSLAGTTLEPLVERLRGELAALGLAVEPRFYLSTEWGVPFGTVAIAIPFYLARRDLVELHAERTAFVEGADARDVMRYLRHELGHVVNYAYRLYEKEEWVELFGAMTQPYREEYRPRPFSREYVRHLPGWYAQKHPDEDWAETFAVWVTPGRDWRRDYASSPGALAKLDFCDRLLAELRGAEPAVVDDELDEDVGELGYSLADFYGSEGPPEEVVPGLDGALLSIFDDGDGRPADARPAAQLVRRLARSLPAEVFRWTGHFPEHTRRLLAQLARRAEELDQVYPPGREDEVARAVTVLVTSLAMSHVHNGTYLP